METRDGIYALGRYYVKGSSSSQNVDYLADDWGYHPYVQYSNVGPHSKASAQIALGKEAIAAYQKNNNEDPPQTLNLDPNTVTTTGDPKLQPARNNAQQYQQQPQKVTLQEQQPQLVTLQEQRPEQQNEVQGLQEVVQPALQENPGIQENQQEEQSNGQELEQIAPQQDQVANKQDQLAKYQDQLANTQDQLTNQQNQLADFQDQVANKQNRIANNQDQVASKQLVQQQKEHGQNLAREEQLAQEEKHQAEEERKQSAQKEEEARNQQVAQEILQGISQEILQGISQEVLQQQLPLQQIQSNEFLTGNNQAFLTQDGNHLAPTQGVQLLYTPQQIDGNIFQGGIQQGSIEKGSTQQGNVQQGSTQQQPLVILQSQPFGSNVVLVDERGNEIIHGGQLVNTNFQGNQEQYTNLQGNQQQDTNLQGNQQQDTNLQGNQQQYTNFQGGQMSTGNVQQTIVDGNGQVPLALPLVYQQQIQVDNGVEQSKLEAEQPQVVSVEGTGTKETAALFDSGTDMSKVENKLSLLSGSYGEKILDEQRLENQRNHQNQPSKLIESTKNLITELDVLNINGAAKFESVPVTQEVNTASVSISTSSSSTSHLQVSTSATVLEHVTPVTPLSLVSNPIIVADYNTATVEASGISEMSEVQKESYAQVNFEDGTEEVVVTPRTEGIVVTPGTEKIIVTPRTEEIVVTPRTEQIVVTPRPDSKFLAPITAGVQLQNIDKPNIDKLNIDNLNVDRLNINKLNIDKKNIDRQPLAKQNIFVEIQKSVPYYVGKYEFLESLDDKSSQDNGALENLKLGGALIDFPVRDQISTILKTSVLENIEKQQNQENNKAIVTNSLDQQGEQGTIQQIEVSSSETDELPKPLNYQTTKYVEKPYPVPYPVEKVVEKYIHRPYPVPVHIPIEVPVERQVPVPYPVEKIIDRPVPVPQPYPYPVEKIVEKKIPVEVTKYVDRPYPVHVAVPQPYPVDKIVEKVVNKPYVVQVPLQYQVVLPQQLSSGHYQYPQVQKPQQQKPQHQHSQDQHPQHPQQQHPPHQQNYQQQHPYLPTPQAYYLPVEPNKKYTSDKHPNNVNTGKIRQYYYSNPYVYVNSYQTVSKNVKNQHQGGQNVAQVTQGVSQVAQIAQGVAQGPQVATQGAQATQEHRQHISYVTNPVLTQHKQQQYVVASPQNYNTQYISWEVPTNCKPVEQNRYIGGLLPPKEPRVVPHKRQAKSFDSPRLEYGFLPPLIPSQEIDENGRPLKHSS